MKILVTGATGFIGKHLCARLRLEGHELTALGSRDADLCDPRSLERPIFVKPRFDHIYHLAAWTQAGDFCRRHQGEQWIINQQIHTHVLAWWQARQPQAKMIAAGTISAYPENVEMVEENYLTGQPPESLFAYGMTKRMLYAGLLSLHRQFRLRYVHLIPSTVYGSDYHTDGRQMHFIFDLVRKIIAGRREGTPVILWGDGTQTRELVHVRDFVEVAAKLADTAENDTFNVGSGDARPIRWYAERICEIVGYDHDLVRYDTSKYAGARGRMLNIGKLQRFMPAYVPSPLAAGLRETVEWMLAQRSFDASRTA
jgi:GDP-L-fucose synthase